MQHVIDIPEPIEFEWDAANKEKIWLKHRVSVEECEEAFMANLVFTQPDELHSGPEDRYILISKTKKDRYLFIVYTLRKHKVRVISARSMHKKEIAFYEKETRTA
jgi:uncharacterized DUF497 family protein